MAAALLGCLEARRRLFAAGIEEEICIKQQSAGEANHRSVTNVEFISASTEYVVSNSKQWKVAKYNFLC